jgi:hypothetical protein
MLKKQTSHNLDGIEFTVVYSRRRTLGIGVLPDSSVVVRVPYLTTLKTINRIVQEKSAWIIKHRDNYRQRDTIKQVRQYINGESHLFRGNESLLKIERSEKSYIRFCENRIEMGLGKTDEPGAIKKLLYTGYKNEAVTVFPELLRRALEKDKNHIFKPERLIIRTMKRRWGSCSNKGVITLSTELIKLPDIYIEYVIMHELCHLIHHNHGAGYYKLLSEQFPGWKMARKELRKYLIH